MTDEIQKENSREARLARLKAQQAAHLQRAKDVSKRIARVESAERLAKRKEDDRTKLLLGVAIIALARRNAAVMDVLRGAVAGLTENDRLFVQHESTLWQQLLDGVPHEIGPDDSDLSTAPSAPHSVPHDDYSAV